MYPYKDTDIQWHHHNIFVEFDDDSNILEGDP